MTDSKKIETKTDPPPADPPGSDVFTIDIKGLEGLTEEHIAAINKQTNAIIAARDKATNETITALTKQIDDISKKSDKAQKDAEATVKATLLEQLKKANYDPEGFKTLDLKSLQTVVNGIAKTNSGIQLSGTGGKTDPAKNPYEATVLDLKSGKRVPFNPQT